MKNLSTFIASIIIFLSLSCRKNEIVYPVASQNSLCWDCDYLQAAYQDSIDHPTILGPEIRNPYTIPIMKQAYRNLYHRDPGSSLPVTHYYWRFSPKNYEELSRLEQEDIELFDYSLHRQLLSEGDFYTEPGKTVEEIPDYYSVAEAGYRPAAGIQAQIIEAMHIPDNNPVLENEALRLTGNLGEENESMVGYGVPGMTGKSIPETNEAVDDLSLPSQGMADCRHYPSGKIVLEDEVLTGHAPRAVQRVRVIVKRHFKVERLYTDDEGRFASRKYFRNKFTILVKFKNSLSHIARMRPKALHEQFFPIKINLGKWSGLDCGHTFFIRHPMSTGTIQTSQWCAALTHNALMEHRKMSMESGIEPPPAGLHIMLSSKQGAGNGNTYMLNQILYSSPAAAGTEVLVAGTVAVWSPVAGGLVILATEAFKARSPDIKYGYGGDPAYLMSDRYTELVYHELAHASTYAIVGNDWWIRFGLAEKGNKGPGPYGECCTEKAYHIALEEGWGYFAGHYFAAMRWGLQSTPFPEQGDLLFARNHLIFGNSGEMSSHEKFLESFNPHRTVDPSHWVPKGLLYDLVDPPSERFTGSGLSDPVGGFTAGEIFRVFSKDIRDIRVFRERLIASYPKRDTAAIRELFAQYGY